MKLLLNSALLQGKLKFAYSTDPTVRIADYGGDQYQTHWAIWIPASQSSQADMTNDWYLTKEVLCLDRRDVMVGRATLVWRVQKLSGDLSQIEGVRGLDVSCEV